MFDRDSFDADWKKMERRNNFMFKWVTGFIAVTFVLIVIWYFLIATVAVKTIGYVDQHGAKGLIERIWEGKDAR